MNNKRFTFLSLIVILLYVGSCAQLQQQVTVPQQSLVETGTAFDVASPTSCDGQWVNCADAYSNDDLRAAFTATDTVNGFGAWYNYCFVIANDATILSVNVKADFLASNPRGFIDIRVSGDGGLTYGPSHIVGGNTTEQTFNIDVTNDIPWTPSMLSTSNFRVSATCFKSPTALADPVCELDWLPVYVTSVCGPSAECTPGNITSGANCGGACDTFRRKCKASCDWGPWVCRPGASITRNCTQYTRARFYAIHSILSTQDESTLPSNLQAQIVPVDSNTTYYYACPPNPTDTGCCPLSSCVYNGVCYTHLEKLDVDSDNVLEICVVDSPGIWIDDFEYDCNDGNDNDYDTFIDCADPDCAGLNVPGGVTCCQSALNCPQDPCVTESCVSNLCQLTNRTLCDSSECPAGSYCNAPGGSCRIPDNSSNVCLYCIADQTTGLPWVPSNHQDAGIGYSTNDSDYTRLFNSDGEECSNETRRRCYDSSNATVSHKPRLTTGRCCGNDPNEFYKPDYYGGECTNNVNDCVWAAGDAQATNTGNAKWWCYLHEWNNCINSTIGSKVGGVTCAGVVGNNAWTPNFLVKPENQYSCNDTKDNDGDTFIDCVDPDCAGLAGPGGVTCCQSVLNCPQNLCAIENCVSNICQYTNRTLCDTAECPANSYCDTPGGSCKTPDDNENVCLYCIADLTTGYKWDWVERIHEDGGKGYSTNTSVYTSLFNSNATACSAASGGPCYNASNNPVIHKSRLTTGSCCGNNPNEFYKPDYYGGECTNNVTDCVWSSGDAQATNTGNAKWWCYLHEWNNCIDSTIGTNVSKISNVSCVGVVGNNAWTPRFLIKPENQYSCTDGKDNDANGLIDCDDLACKPVIIGIAANQQSQRVPNVDVSLRTGLTIVKSAITGQLGNYTISQINCGTYNLIASHADYLPNSRTITLSSGQQATIDLAMILGTSCEPDCTYFGDNIVHASCDAKNGCTFYDSISRAACDNSQPGWIRDYSATHYVVCASGAPQPKVEIKASVSCESGTLIKVTRIVLYNGKPVKLVVAACS